MGEPVVVRTQSELFNPIDGVAPKYTELGWVASAYITYRQNGRGLSVAIHDMGTAKNAEDIFNIYLPQSRSTIQGRANTALDLGLPPAYRSFAFLSRYYIEIAIDDRCDAALTSIQAFTIRVLDRDAGSR